MMGVRHIVENFPFVGTARHPYRLVAFTLMVKQQQQQQQQ